MTTEHWEDRIDDEGDRIARQEQVDRAAEKGSVGPQDARTALAALEPSSGPMPSLRYQGTIPPPRATVSGWRKLLRILGWFSAIVLAWILAGALAIGIFLMVAWGLS